MVVRTWRKISAPGRLGHNSKHSPSNVVQQVDKSNPVSAGYGNVNKSQLPRRAVARQLFDSHGFQQRNETSNSTDNRTTGELAINYLLLEFSSYARYKIEKALKTVKY